jgi:hypothetical protein
MFALRSPKYSGLHGKAVASGVRQVDSCLSKMHICIPRVVRGSELEAIPTGCTSGLNIWLAGAWIVALAYMNQSPASMCTTQIAQLRNFKLASVHYPAPLSESRSNHSSACI